MFRRWKIVLLTVSSLIVFLVIAFYKPVVTAIFPLLGRYRVVGRVTDISTASPVELAEVTVNQNKTYTNFLGFFHYENLPFSPQIELSFIPDLELAENGFFCSESYSIATFDLLSSCRFEVAPTLISTARRFAQSRLQESREPDFSIDERNRISWQIAYPQDRSLWEDNLDDYLLWNRYQDWIDDRLEKRIVSFSFYSDPIELGSWTNPLTGVYYADGVWESETTWERQDGSTQTTKEHFRKEDRWWRHFISQDPDQLRLYVMENNWIIKLIEKGKM
ncbi:hypothetical protein COT52_02835 [candidate division WWE3 bacterium CG08_land_8_20_14_0_20_43_13]|uniref:Uncharacterized protein n=1 Tax=candidate division WWE3 bacterium CG08_land_8_20_14_0_20_43_13 TaxID=1975087 RepID=A0A2H0X6R9_UNCKA|nr:MAG: hypothetical protein COT52_02835 [candidate division WWE3 bacterium CG08_land_8_20_14_0_20_43_13]